MTVLKKVSQSLLIIDDVKVVNFLIGRYLLQDSRKIQGKPGNEGDQSKASVVEPRKPVPKLKTKMEAIATGSCF